MIEVEIHVRIPNRKKGFSTFDEIDIIDTLQNMFEVEEDDVELDWNFAEDEDDSEDEE